MRRILGYIEGRPIWSANEPGHAVLYRGSIRGELVVGAPGPTENERKRKRVREREGANAAQRAYYARKKGAA